MFSTDELKKIRRTFNNKKELFITSSFKALSDTNRNRIFRLLTTQPQLSAGDIAETLKISRPLTSQHLKILEHAGLLKKKKEGQHKFYMLDRHNRTINPFVNIIMKIV